MKRTNKHTDVEEALDLLSTEVREEIERIRNEGADAMKSGDYATATSVIDFAGKLEKFAGNVDKLIGEWSSIAKQHEAELEPVKSIVGKSFFGKARKGTITTHKEFYVPLLQALVQMGGGGKTQKVVDQVGKLMVEKLKPKDLETLNSNSDTIRWRNKVMWTRNTLVNELGYMKGDSPRGFWEISEKGRTWLNKQTTR
jgi:restriction system protein